MGSVGPHSRRDTGAEVGALCDLIGLHEAFMQELEIWGFLGIRGEL
jgi:hypothetical protein